MPPLQRLTVLYPFLLLFSIVTSCYSLLHRNQAKGREVDTARRKSTTVFRADLGIDALP